MTEYKVVFFLLSLLIASVIKCALIENMLWVSLKWNGFSRAVDKCIPHRFMETKT